MPQENKFTYIDLCSGIGAFHFVLSELGVECVLAADKDPQANDNYTLNHGMSPFGAIEDIPHQHIPDHDLLCAGFPCQPFSLSGKLKGFEDPRGPLFTPLSR